MGKKPLFLLLFLAILLNGCHKETNTKIIDAGIIERMDFDDIAGLYTINMNDTENNTIFIYGTCDGIKEADLKKLNSLPMEVTLVTASGNNIAAKKEHVHWSSGEPMILENKFTLEITVASPIKLDSEMNQIVFTLNDKIIKKDMKDFYLNIFQGTNHGMTVVEAPIAPVAVPYLNSNYSISCKILDKHNEIPNLQAAMKYPDDMNKFIEITNIRVTRDGEMEAVFKKKFKKKIKKDNIENITVYNTEYDYQLKQTKDFIFKPQIILTDGKETQALTPDIPVCFFHIKNQENTTNSEKNK